MNELNIYELIKKVWSRRLFVIITTTAFIVFGVIIALVSPNIFKAESTFVPQSQSTELPGAFGNLASLAGINLNDAGATSEISPSLYPEVVNSIPFKLRLLRTPISNKFENSTYGSYLVESTKSWFKRKIENFLPKALPEELINYNNELIKISDEEFKQLEALDGKISIAVNDKVGFINLAVEDRDPYVAAFLTQMAVKYLQEKIIDLKTKRAKELYDFTEKQWLQKKDLLFNKQDSLALMQERNLNISSPYEQNKINRLQTELDIASTIFREISSQKEQIALQLQKDTPIFSVVKPVVIPNEKFKPKRALIVITFAMIGFLLSMYYLFSLEQILNPKGSIKKD